MKQEYIERLLGELGLDSEYKKTFRFGNGVLATNRLIMAVSQFTEGAIIEYGDPAALEPVGRMLESLPDVEFRTVIDINLLKQAVEIFDEHRVVELNLYPKSDGSHFIEIVAHDGKAVLFPGMYTKDPNVKPFPTIKEQFSKIDPAAFRDYGAGI